MSRMATSSILHPPCRELKIRDSYPVARYGSLLLEHHKRSLGEEECEGGCQACTACTCMPACDHTPREPDFPCPDMSGLPCSVVGV